MTAYRYDGSFAGFLTCVWDALEHNIEPVAFLLPEDGATLWEERELPVDEEKARRLYAALARRVSGRFRHFIAWGFLTCLPQRELALFTLIRRGMREGKRAAWDLSDPVMARVMLAYQKLATEQDHLKGFVRFSDLEGMLVGEIEPKNRVLPILAPHFSARFSGEKLALYDRTHREIFLSDRGRWRILPAEDFRMGSADKTEREFREMWRRYFQHIAIEGRLNPKCQSTHLPKRYRHVMTEFMTGEEPGNAKGLSTGMCSLTKGRSREGGTEDV